MLNRFFKYVGFHTTSDENTGLTPSTPGQMTFAEYLAEELKQIGLTDVTLDGNGYVMATLPANTESAGSGRRAADRPLIVRTRENLNLSFYQ